MSTFTPEELTFQQGAERVRAALTKAGIDLEKTVVTSRDPRVQELREELRMRNAPAGFNMWQLPVTVRNALLFISAAGPNATVAEHRHALGPVFRLVISGSITYSGTELTAGDWMYVPKGQPYSFQTGPMGAVLLYPHAE